MDLNPCTRGHRPNRCTCGKNKGAYGGPCNRTACDRYATMFNRVTRGFYCVRCARSINSYPSHDGQPLCVEVPNAV